MKYIITFLIGLMVGVSGFWMKPEPEIKIIKQTEVRWKPHQTVYNQRRDVLIDRLRSYDAGAPTLEGKIDNNIFKAKAGLCERTWERDFTLDVGSSGNWKICVGIGLGCITAGIIIGKIF